MHKSLTKGDILYDISMGTYYKIVEFIKSNGARLEDMKTGLKISVSARELAKLRKVYKG